MSTIDYVGLTEDALASSDSSRRNELALAPSPYPTHVYIHSYSPLADDLIGESNHHVILEALLPLGEESSSTLEDDEEADVTVIRVRSWAYAYYDCIAVRVFKEHPDGMTSEDAQYGSRIETEKEFTENDLTPAWKKAIELLSALEQHPILDEFDHSEREHEEVARYVSQEILDENLVEQFWEWDSLQNCSADSDTVHQQIEAFLTEKGVDRWGDPLEVQPA